MLNKQNIIYIIEKITKPKYKDLAFLISNSNKVDIISKTIIFVNNIKDA